MATFVAIRGTGSNAPAPAGERGVRPAWPTVGDMLEEEEPREGEVNAEGNAPQQRADPFPFATPRIPTPDLAITCFSWPFDHKCDRSHFFRVFPLFQVFTKVSYFAKFISIYDL